MAPGHGTRIRLAALALLFTATILVIRGDWGGGELAVFLLLVVVAAFLFQRSRPPISPKA